MTGLVPTASPAASPCKICGGAAELFGVVDFNKSCEEVRGYKLPLSGVAVYYRRCSACGFVYTDFFNAWTQAEFTEFIYNDNYVKVDPDYLERRPMLNAQTISSMFGRTKNIALLDYGGGTGRLSECLRSDGFAIADSFDPLTPHHATLPARRYDVVTCFEVLEHLCDPISGIESIARHVDERGIVYFSTSLQDADFDKAGLGWWYIGPRNGHISIFSRSALTLAWGRFGFRIGSFNNNFHLAFRQIPDFAAHLFGPPKTAQPG
jgi:SAM-dependent methyltransferase